MIHEPERDFSNTGRPFTDLDAVELIHVHLRDAVDFVEGQFPLSTEKQHQGFKFKLTQFAISNDKEISAAASGIEKTQSAKFLLKFLQPRGAPGGAVAFTGFKLGPQVVKEERSYDF